MLLINIFVFFAVFLSMIQSILSDVYVYNSSNKLITSLNDQSARFGPSFPSDGLKGYITTTNPQNACQQISPPPDIQTSGYRWIALIPRTNDGDSCEFIVKVQNAQNANFSAVIIYNYEDSLLSMGSSTKTVRIPSTLITHTDGLLLISHYLYNKTTVNSTPIYHVKLIPEPPFQFGIYLIVFVVIVAISFLGLIGFLLVKCHLQRRRLNRHRLPRSALKQLKIKKFVKTDPWEVCVICLDDFEEGAKLRILPCAHAYHMKCIDPWLLNNRRQCPVCKRYVFPNLDNSDDEEASNRRRPRPATEQTPLIFSHDLDESTEISVRRQLPQRPLLHPSNSGPRNITVAFNESSDETDESLLSSRPTTTEIMFDRRSSNPRHYGSLHDPSITHRAVNFLAESAGATANTTHPSIHSIIEPFYDSETIDNTDGRMHSVIVASGDNPAYAEDDESTEDTIRTNL